MHVHDVKKIKTSEDNTLNVSGPFKDGEAFF